MNLREKLRLRGQQQTFGDLLGDGAPSLDDAAGQEILPGGPQDRDQVDAAMLEEVGVFGGDEGLDQPARHARHRHDDPPLLDRFRQ